MINQSRKGHNYERQITAELHFLDKVIELNPEHAGAYWKRGLAKDNLGNHRGSIRDYNKFIELNPEHAGAYLLRGLAKHNLEDKEGACLDWSKAGELGETDAYWWIKEFCD